MAVQNGGCNQGDVGLDINQTPFRSSGHLFPFSVILDRRNLFSLEGSSARAAPVNDIACPIRILASDGPNPVIQSDPFFCSQEFVDCPFLIILGDLLLFRTSALFVMGGEG
jgi:hypothetical protein